MAERSANAWEAIEALRGIYSGTIGYDVDHVRVPEQRQWLRQAAETGRFRPPQAPIDEVALLKLLTNVETFERFLHRTFPGKTRFSIEGLDLLVPMLDEMVCAAGQDGLPSILIGMAHRGRLNVLAHILNKPYAQILAEFKDPVKGRRQAVREDDLGWTGDVKYHLGARREDVEGQLGQMLVALAPNPSHLEAVNPVVEGMARAAGTRVDQPGPAHFDAHLTLPILIHGDVSFPGQGVVAETLNLSRLPGWRTGGTLHIIANNQLGFTTPSEQGRSTLYASDLAKGFEIPIVHVNADDPVACLEVARLAYAYRAQFREDFLIDLIGYRRYGHNEGDEPAFTQPLMYAAIARQPTVREQWAARLAERGRSPPSKPRRWCASRWINCKPSWKAFSRRKPSSSRCPSRRRAAPPAGWRPRCRPSVCASCTRRCWPCQRGSPPTPNCRRRWSGGGRRWTRPTSRQLSGRTPSSWRWPLSWRMARRSG